MRSDARCAIMSAIGHFLTQIGVASAHPAAFLVVIAFTVAWLIFQPETLDWHGIATLATWTMTLFIQRAEHRDTQAIQAKLDELLRASAAARGELADLDERDAEEIERYREREKHGGGANPGQPA
jgi:low affinity Fe/Cu permease